MPRTTSKPESRREDLGELGPPIETTAAVEIRADQGVPASDIAGHPGTSRLLDPIPILARIEHEQEKREAGQFDRGGVDVHAEDGVEQDPPAFGEGQMPGGLRIGDSEEGGVRTGRPFRGSVFHVEAEVPVEEALVCGEKEGAGAAGGVEDAHRAASRGVLRSRSRPRVRSMR